MEYKAVISADLGSEDERVHYVSGFNRKTVGKGHLQGQALVQKIPFEVAHAAEIILAPPLAVQGALGSESPRSALQYGK